MPALLQVAYASRSSFPATSSGGIERELARILLVSRRNNPRRGLVGALYFGDGCFFQCLEGPQDAVESLLTTLETDPRHSNLKILSRRVVKRRSFSAWSMKYVPAEESIRRLLAAQRLDRFDPYRFDTSTLEGMIRLLQSAADPGADAGDPSIALVNQEHQRQVARVARLAWLALGASALSLIATAGLAIAR